MLSPLLKFIAGSIFVALLAFGIIPTCVGQIVPRPEDIARDARTVDMSHAVARAVRDPIVGR
ncbi:MAG: hypothetical protein ABJA67_15395 [Chthonomonadales bacterium]